MKATCDRHEWQLPDALRVLLLTDLNSRHGSRGPLRTTRRLSTHGSSDAGRVTLELACEVIDDGCWWARLVLGIGGTRYGHERAHRAQRNREPDGRRKQPSRALRAARGLAARAGSSAAARVAPVSGVGQRRLPKQEARSRPLFHVGARR